MWTEIREWVMLVAELYVCYILTHEFFYDKQVYEQKRRKVKRTKNTVKVSLEDGQIKILEKPKDVDVTIEHKENME